VTLWSLVISSSKVKISIHPCYSSVRSSVSDISGIQLNLAFTGSKSWQIGFPKQGLLRIWPPFCLFLRFHNSRPGFHRPISDRITETGFHTFHTFFGELYWWLSHHQSSGNHQVSIFDYYLRWVFSVRKEIRRHFSGISPSTFTSSAPSTVRDLPPSESTCSCSGRTSVDFDNCPQALGSSIWPAILPLGRKNQKLC